MITGKEGSCRNGVNSKEATIFHKATIVGKDIFFLAVSREGGETLSKGLHHAGGIKRTGTKMAEEDVLVNLAEVNRGSVTGDGTFEITVRVPVKGRTMAEVDAEEGGIWRVEIIPALIIENERRIVGGMGRITSTTTSTTSTTRSTSKGRSESGWGGVEGGSR